MKLSMLISLFTLGTTAFAQFSITDYPPSEYQGGDLANLAAMRTSLGIDSLIIEDFDELRLPEGRLHFSGVTDVVTENGHSWGETGTGFIRILTEAESNVVLQIDGGTPVLGIGFSAFESGAAGGGLTSLSINNGSPTPLNNSTLPSFLFTWRFRNGYLIIEAQGSNSIEQVEFSHTGNMDGYQIDYLAYAGGNGLSPNPTIEKVGTNVVFAFQSVMGETNSIEESTDLALWDDAITNVVGDGKVMKFIFDTHRTQNFFRLPGL